MLEMKEIRTLYIQVNKMHAGGKACIKKLGDIQNFHIDMAFCQESVLTT